MRVLTTSAIVVLLAGSAASIASAAVMTVPAGTQVDVRLVNSLSSGTATAGQPFTFEAAKPVLVGNAVVIAKGANGTGHVVSVSRAQGKSAGKITLAFTTIHSADGSVIMLTQDSSHKGNAEKGKASTATIASTILLGPVGLFAHNMVKGKDVTINSDRVFHAWVRSNTSVTVR